MKVVSAEQMRELDRRAIEEFGVPGVVLMENAGRAVVEEAAKAFPPLQGKRVVVFCGAGNNGGDGFVIARYLLLAGAEPTIVMVGNEDALKADARAHYEIARRLQIPIRTASSPPPDVQRAELYVDALLGTGIKDAPKPPYADAIELMNESDKPIVAVDIPSGVDADTGAIPGAAVRAALTVTFGYPKLGLLTYPGAECVGRLLTVDIGFDWDRIDLPSGVCLFAEEDFRAGVQKRHPDSNKGIYGHVGIVAGSRGMAGAPALVARAAQRTGAGLVTVLTAASVQPVLAGKLDEQMTLPLPEADGAVSEAAFDAIARFAEKATVLCVGPGLTTAPGAVALVHRLITEIDRPLVFDADGLNALALQPDIISRRTRSERSPLVLTPHPGEAARLLNISIEQVQADRFGAVRELARRFHAVALLKGRYTLVSDVEGSVTINTTGNPGMAAGGSGDALTGVIGGMLAQALAPGKGADTREGFLAAVVSPEKAVSMGVYLHGAAGDLAARKIGEIGMAASDLVERLPAARRILEGDA